MRRKVALRGEEHAVQPRQQVLAAVVGVQDDRDAVLLRHRAHVEGARHGARDRSLEVRVVEALARVELRAARRELNNDRRVHLAGGLEAGVDAGGGHAVHRGDRVAALLRVVEQVNERLPSHDARVHRLRHVRVRLEGALADARDADVVGGRHHGDRRRPARRDAELQRRRAAERQDDGRRQFGGVRRHFVMLRLISSTASA